VPVGERPALIYIETQAGIPSTRRRSTAESSIAISGSLQVAIPTTRQQPTAGGINLSPWRRRLRPAARRQAKLLVAYGSPSAQTLRISCNNSEFRLSAGSKSKYFIVVYWNKHPDKNSGLTRELARGVSTWEAP
jgi:hypothetical protein